MSEFAGKEDAVQDLQGNWWYQDPMTASWYIWNGQAWQWVPAAAPRVAPRHRVSTPKKRAPWSCLLTSFTGVLLVLIIVGGITLVAFNFFPAYHINPGQGDIAQIVKLGGGGLLVTLLGVFMVNGGFHTVLTSHKKVEGEWGEEREKRGCGTILNGLGQLFFGLLFLAVGLALIAVALFQEILPWFGF